MSDSQKKSLPDPLLLLFAALVMLGACGWYFYSEKVKQRREAVLKAVEAKREEHVLKIKVNSALKLDKKHGEILAAKQILETWIMWSPNVKGILSAKSELAKLKKKLEASGTVEGTPEREQWIVNYKAHTSLFNIKQLLMGRGKGKEAVLALKGIIKEYPDTEAAKEAKKMLDEFKQEEKP